ncbi:MAG: 4'-phosphopantetheinyl transferase superfamily protein [Muribaculaceae bacterium]|nr:4'-phosphopantetheinyl transferase superfamily protein [Muribaculaceae bacterium]
MAPIIVHNTHIYIRELPSEIDSLLPQCSAEIIEQLNSISSPRRKREIIARHLIIKDIWGESVNITHDENGAPLLCGVDGYISISHSATEIAVAYNPLHNIGIDIENWREQIIKVKSRFLSPQEMNIYTTPQLMLKAWTLKEAIYKVAQSPGISLANDIMLPLAPNETIAKVNTCDGIRDIQTHEIISTPSRCVTLAFPLLKTT